MPPKKLSENQVARLSQFELEAHLAEWKVDVPAGAKVLMKRALLDAAMSGDTSVCKVASALAKAPIKVFLPARSGLCLWAGY